MENCILRYLLFLLVSSNLFASNFFTIITSNDNISIPIILCLNGKSSLSCQNYIITGYDLMIKSSVDRVYKECGIKALGNNYNYLGCTPYQNGYCLFKADNSNYTTIKIKAP